MTPRIDSKDPDSGRRSLLDRWFWLRKLRARAKAGELGVLSAMLIIVLATWGFIELADEVLEGSTKSFDRAAVEFLREADDASQLLGPHWIAEAARDVTALGSVSVLSLCILAAAGFLAVLRAYRSMWLLLGATVSGIVVSLLMKRMFARPRPDIVPHLADVTTSSFPSGHSMMSAIVYLTIAAVIAASLEAFWLRTYVILSATVLAGLVGLSRVLLGVHYPTDVLAGWAAGLAWALAFWLVGRYFGNRRIES